MITSLIGVIASLIGVIGGTLASLIPVDTPAIALALPHDLPPLHPTPPTGAKREDGEGAPAGEDGGHEIEPVPVGKRRRGEHLHAGLVAMRSNPYLSVSAAAITPINEAITPINEIEPVPFGERRRNQRSSVNSGVNPYLSVSAAARTGPTAPPPARHEFHTATTAALSSSVRRPS